MRKSAKIPFPPSNSRPKATVSLAFKLIHDCKQQKCTVRKHLSCIGSVVAAPMYHRVPSKLRLTFPKLAWPGVIFPFSYNLQRRQPTKVIAWTFPSILTSFSWLSWKAASGAPNCFLSFRYLSNHLQVGISLYC